MSNRNLFGDDDLGNDPFGDQDFDDNLDFGEENLDDFESLDDVDLGDDFPDEEPAGGTTGGPNRTFIILAVLMLLVFVVGLGVILFLATRETGPTPSDMTRVAIENINATRFINLTETEVQRTVFAAATETEAARPTETATPTDTPTETPTLTLAPTDTPDAALNETAQAETAAADALVGRQETETALTEQAGLSPSATFTISAPGTLSAGDVLLTATALFLTLNPTPATPVPGGDGTTIPIITPGGTFPTPRPGDSELPDTGLFDGFASGDGMGTVALLAVGLLGVIVISRRLRKDQ